MSDAVQPRKVFKESEYRQFNGPAEPPLQDVREGAQGAAQTIWWDIRKDSKIVGNALVAFPYSSAFKCIGFLVVMYGAFKLLGKFVNINSKVAHIMRGIDD